MTREEAERLAFDVAEAVQEHRVSDAIRLILDDALTAAQAQAQEGEARLREALGAAADGLFRAKNMLSAIYDSDPSADRKKACDRANAAWLAALKALNESAPAPEPGRACSGLPVEVDPTLPSTVEFVLRATGPSFADRVVNELRAKGFDVVRDAPAAPPSEKERT